MYKIQICWTKGVHETEASAVRSGVADVLKCVPRQFSVEIMGATCALDSWAERCRRGTDQGYGPQLDARRILDQIPSSLAQYALDRGRTPSSVSCLTVAITDSDISAGDNRFLFGLGFDGIGAVLSVAWLRDLNDSDIGQKVLRRLARHEFGHALGLIPDDRRFNVEDKIGLHCTNLCTMRQGMRLPDFVELTTEEEQAGVTFCSECAQHLESVPANLKVLFGGQSDAPNS